MDRSYLSLDFSKGPLESPLGINVRVKIGIRIKVRVGVRIRVRVWTFSNFRLIRTSTKG